MARILIVESDPQHMRQAVLLLENAGHDVLQANDARIGVNLARAYQPALILMDTQLPEMEGLAACRTIKDDRTISHSKVYAMTAFDARGEIESIRAAGCDGHIAKPISSLEFLKTIVEALAADDDGT